MLSNSQYRFGSAEVADERDYRKAGLYSLKDDAVLLGFHGKRALAFSGQGGILTCAGPRSGKLRDVIGYTACGIGYQGNMIVLNVKNELSSIAKNQAFTRRHIININPYGMHDGAQDRIDLLGHIKIDSPTLIADLKAQCESISPETGAKNSAYFQVRAQEFAEAIALGILERDSSLSLSTWYEAINLLIEGGENWLDFSFYMHISRYPHVRRVEEEIANNRDSSGSGFQGILGELSKSFRACSDPKLLEAFSPPFTFSFADMLKEDKRYVVYVTIPQELMGIAAMPVKQIFSTAMTIKSRAPQAPMQLWLLDEAPALGTNPVLVKAHTIGAGMNIRPWTVTQSLKQLDGFGSNARDIILASSSVRQFFGVRDPVTAKIVSELSGDETLVYDDTLAQMKAAQRRQAAAAAIIQGENMIKTALQFQHEKPQTTHQSKMKRPLRTQEEVLNAPADRQFIFCDHVPKLIYCERKPYYEQHWMAGAFFSNPYHQKNLGTVRTKNKYFGHRTRRIKEMSPPKHLAHLHQYQNQPVRYVQGFKP